MKAELKFEYDTENYDQLREIKTLQNAQAFKGILWDIDQKLREQLKYNNELSESAYVALEEIRSFLYECLRENNVDLLD